MVTKRLKLAVIEESTKLRQNARPSERARLNYFELSPQNTFLCIYGQMTGNCFSRRSSVLLELCAVPYSSSLERSRNPNLDSFPKFRYARDTFSAIEFYIVQPKAKNKKLVEFIRGEINDLQLQDL